VSARPGIAAVALALLAATPAARGAADEPRTYTLAVVPQGPPEKLRAAWLPVVERLSADAQVPLGLKLYSTVEDFQADLAAGRVDLAYANPVQAMRARRAAGYRPLVRDAKPAHGVFLVAADSPYTSLADLASRDVAFVAPWTFCSVSLRARVRNELAITPRFVGTAANVYKNVLLGLTAGGGVLDSTFAEAPPEVQARLRLLYETPPMASHPILAHPRVAPEVGARFTASVIRLARSDPALLAKVRLSAPVEAVYARDYAPLEYLIADDTADPAPPRQAR
jgi:phosphonate transport system substrate-binding protein